MNFFPQPCLAFPDSLELRAKQGHGESTTFAPKLHSHPPASGALRSNASAERSRVRPASAPRTLVGAWRPLRAKARPGNAGREQSVPQSPIPNPQSSFPSLPRTCPDPVGALVGALRPLREQSAFSLTEVVIAMGVAAVAFTSIIALFPLGLNMSKESYEATQAALIAQTILADVKDQQTGSGNDRSPKSPWNTKLIQIANNSDPIKVLTNYATVQIDKLTPQIVYIAYKPFVGTGNDTDTNNPAMLRPSTGIYTTNTPNWYSTGSNGATMLVKVTFSPTIRIGSATSLSSPQRVDVSVETPGSASITNRTCYLFTGAVRP